MQGFAFTAAAFIVATVITLPAVAGTSTAPSDASSHTTLAVTAGQLAGVARAQSAVAPRSAPAVSGTNGTDGATGGTSVGVTIPDCFPDVTGTVEAVVTVNSPLGVGGTTSADLEQFARAYNAIRVANCLPPIALENFHFDACMQARLFWMAEDPSTDPTSAWGHVGSVRSDGVASTGCDGNLAGGKSNTPAIVAQKWWDSLPHRATLYRPDDAIGGVCIYFAMTHGGVPNEDYDFVRAAARWDQC
jgi:hypothetical protein